MCFSDCQHIVPFNHAKTSILDSRNQWEVKRVISSSSLLIACNELLLKWGHVQSGLVLD